MAHSQQSDFISIIREHFPDFFRRKRVLEIGSLDLGGTIRSNFTDCEYIGADVSQGPGVDIACQGQLLDFPTGHFNVTVSCECFEHNPWWVETFVNMLRMTRPGGLVIMTCATSCRAEHGTTRSLPNSSPLTVDLGWDYYKNLTERDVRRHIPLKNWFDDFIFISSAEHYDLYFVGRVKSGGNLPEALKTQLRTRFTPWGSTRRALKHVKMTLAEIVGHAARS